MLYYNCKKQFSLKKKWFFLGQCEKYFFGKTTGFFKQAKKKICAWA